MVLVREPPFVSEDDRNSQWLQLQAGLVSSLWPMLEPCDGGRLSVTNAGSTALALFFVGLDQGRS